MPDSPFETRPIRYRFLSRSSCGKVSQATQDKWRRLKKLFAKRRQSSKFPSLILTRGLQLEKVSARKKMFYQALLLVFDHVSDESGHIIFGVPSLVSLMEDQVKYLRSLGLSAVNISSNKLTVHRSRKENIQFSMAHLKHGL